MKGTRASLRYAKAAIEYAEQAGVTEKVAADLKGFKALFLNYKELQTTFASPMLSPSDKERLVKELLPDACEQTKEVFSLLALNNRMELLLPCCEKFLELFAHQKGEVKATVTTAISLTPELEKQILKKAKELSGKEALLENKIDSSIIGGYILKIGDMQYDASLSNQLKALKTKLIQTNSI
jgi:F-type H+-transporting ATPase subunit delta